uniref:ATP-dependent DNA helicase n=1 Tax=Phyllostachys edulis TaxID=38705 RepID=D3IVP0_PHYED|nr:putative retrotransposon protein [Phyllostachys edulis]
MGGRINRSINQQKGPYVFSVCGQVYHRIGSLLPSSGTPKFVELYVYDTDNEIHNRIRALDPSEDTEGNLDPEIVSDIMHMLDEHNPLVRQFRCARDRLREAGDESVGIRIVGARAGDPIQYNLPTCDELALLVVGDFSLETYKRDIVVHNRSNEVRQISPLHPAFMALQYPLLFPYGGRRYMVQNYHDAIAICRVHGPPDLFITFTCNPRWPEITEALAFDLGERVTDRADIVDRVYNMKLEELLTDIKDGSAFGPINALLHAVEFQKRGLPHAHIIAWLARDTAEPTSALIDSFVCAEIPDPQLDPLGYALVSEHMMHGPCGLLNDRCPCMKNGSCSKFYPKSFQNETTIDRDGFALYKRPDNGRYIIKGNTRLDNRWVVPYNMSLLKKYGAHINVEWCNKTKVLKYLFKYVTKGQDYAKVSLRRLQQGEDAPSDPQTSVVNEVQEYLDCRYICEHDAIWRILEYDIHRHFPSVERLTVHLPKMNSLCFNPNANLSNVVSNTFLARTPLTEWFVANCRYTEAHALTYCEFPSRWLWDTNTRSWQKRRAGKKIGRLYFVHPSVGEQYYLRMLLMLVKGAKSYEDIRTFQGILYSTFKEACSARGLLGNDVEWYRTLEEASKWASSSQLRHLFVTMLLFCDINDEHSLFDKFWLDLAEDFKYRFCRATCNPYYVMPVDDLKDLLLDEISALLKRNGTRISSFNLPARSGRLSHNYTNSMISDELSYDITELSNESRKLCSMLNPDQKHAFECVVSCVAHNQPGFFFVSGYGGTGKTFLWNAITSYLRSTGKIVLTVASSGVASLLLPGGRTAHSRFKIPIDVDETSICDIKRGTMLAELIKTACVVIWDEALMAHRKCFEALDRTFRDILHDVGSAAHTMPFGGKVFVLGGDLRQILPVIEGGARAQIVDAAIVKSPLWNNVTILPLTINMRLSAADQTTHATIDVANFSQWILDLGDGRLPATASEGESEPYWIEIPAEFLILTEGDKVAAIVNAIYNNFEDNFCRPEYLRSKAILSPTNETVDEINSFVLTKVPGAETEYLSCDTISKSADTAADADLLYPLELLNSINPNNFPQHRLLLKLGVPVMLFRNLNQSIGLCNGTRLIISRLADVVIEATVMTGSAMGQTVYIPRITLISTDRKWPFRLQRRQFPLRVCYAMTINKSQGQTLQSVGIYLKKPVFTHGQLYVAVSRVTCREGLKILIENEDGTCGTKTKNIVYQEILQSL